MKWLIERSRYLALIGVGGLLVCAVTAFTLGVYKTFRTVVSIALQEAKDDFALILLFDCLDSFLVATAMLVMSVSLYELFIGEMKVPVLDALPQLERAKGKIYFCHYSRNGG